MTRTRVNIFVFTLTLWLVLWSGTAAWLGYHHAAFWPWSHQWYMFSVSSDYIFKLQAIGYTEDYVSTDLDLGAYFSYPVTHSTTRADELPRSEPSLLKLAHFLCGKNPSLFKIQFNQEEFRKQRGRLPDFTRPPERVRVRLRPTDCPRRSGHDPSISG